MNKDLETHQLPGTNIYIDNFYKPVSDKGHNYVLSHFHGDHYGRLSERWDAPIHCSPLTARLAATSLGVAPNLLVPHSLGEPFVVDGHVLEFLSAEHCPGAVMILAKVGDLHYLHTGDCRATPKLIADVKRRGLPKIHTLFLDTTYASSKSSFADQNEVIERVAQDLGQLPATTLVLVGAYTIGKERVIFRLARQLNCKIYLPNGRKKSIYACLDIDDEDNARFTDDPLAAQIHVVPLSFCGEMWPFFKPNYEKCEEHLSKHPCFNAVVGVIPTGHANASNWNRKHEVVNKGRVTIRLYAYSEHSSAQELQNLVRLVKPVKLVPTVFRDKKDQTNIHRRFHHLLDKAGAARQLFASAKKASFDNKKEEPKDPSPEAPEPEEPAWKKPKLAPAKSQEQFFEGTFEPSKGHEGRLVKGNFGLTDDVVDDVGRFGLGAASVKGEVEEDGRSAALEVERSAEQASPNMIAIEDEDDEDEKEHEAERGGKVDAAMRDGQTEGGDTDLDSDSKPDGADVAEPIKLGGSCDATTEENELMLEQPELSYTVGGSSSSRCTGCNNNNSNNNSNNNTNNSNNNHSDNIKSSSIAAAGVAAASPCGQSHRIDSQSDANRSQGPSIKRTFDKLVSGCPQREPVDLDDSEDEGDRDFARLPQEESGSGKENNFRNTICNNNNNNNNSSSSSSNANNSKSMTRPKASSSIPGNSSTKDFVRNAFSQISPELAQEGISPPSSSSSSLIGQSDKLQPSLEKGGSREKEKSRTPPQASKNASADAGRSIGNSQTCLQAAFARVAQLEAACVKTEARPPSPSWYQEVVVDLLGSSEEEEG